MWSPARCSTGLRPPLGQHFLADAGLARRIASAAAQPGDVVLEIGAGRGALTRELLEAVGPGGRVVAIEFDKRLADRVGETFRSPGLKVIQGDALRIDWRRAAGGGGYALAGNLPYAITSPLLLQLLRTRGWRRAVFMMQREVVDRLLAAPGTPEYGSLTVAVTNRCELARLCDVPPWAFSPPPRVHSTVLTLTPRPSPRATARPAFFERVVRGAFGQRRKTLANAVAAGLGRTRDAVILACARAGLDPVRRGETLSIEEFDRLAVALTARRKV